MFGQEINNSNIRYRECCNVENSILTHVRVIFTQIPVIGHRSTATEHQIATQYTPERIKYY